MKSGIEILQSRRLLAVVAGMKNPNDYAEPTKSRTLKNNNNSFKHIGEMIG